MYPPEVYERAAREAAHHLQMTVEGIVIEAEEARLSGAVIEVFRGRPDLLGTKMSLRVPYFRPGDPFPPGGIGRFPVESLRVGRVLEALVNDGPSGPEIPVGLCTIIDAATAAPQLLLEFKPVAQGSRKAPIALVALGALIALTTVVFLLVR